MRKRTGCWLTLLLALCIGAGLAGCGKKADSITEQAFMLDTFISVTIYDSKDKRLLDKCFSMVEEYEGILSRTREDSEIYQMNHRPMEKQVWQVSPKARKVLDKGLSYSRLSDGAFDITVEPLSSLWDFGGETPHVPDDGQIQEALGAVGYHNLQMDGNQLMFLSPDTQIDLGGIAKGYIADQLKEYLVAHGVKSAIINLGGNVLCIGSKPDGSPFKVGLQKPFGDQEESAAMLDIVDKSVVTSGVYERYFTENGKNYHHILDPRTGYPYENGIAGVTIISPSSVDGDGLSTVCFALGLEDGRRLLDSMSDACGIFIMEDGSLEYTKGAEALVAKEKSDG